MFLIEELNVGKFFSMSVIEFASLGCSKDQAGYSIVPLLPIV